MKNLIELILYCAIFTLMVRIFAGSTPLNCLYFYPKEYQEKAYEKHLADRKTVQEKRKRFLWIFTSIMCAVLILIIGAINGVRDYWNAYLQSLLFLEVMNWYDGIVIDRLWVGHDRFWYIEEMKECPYIQTWDQVLKKRSFLTIVWIVASFLVAGIVVVLF